MSPIDIFSLFVKIYKQRMAFTFSASDYSLIRDIVPEDYKGALRQMGLGDIYSVKDRLIQVFISLEAPRP